MTVKGPSAIWAYLTTLLIGLFIGILLLPAHSAVSYLFFGRSIQTLYANGTEHRAELRRSFELSDFNFIVEVDGERVYRSGDHWPMPDHVYRETLIWDKTGNVVVLEMLGEWVFAYDAESKKKVGPEELKKYEFSPRLRDSVCVDPGYLKH